MKKTYTLMSGAPTLEETREIGAMLKEIRLRQGLSRSKASAGSGISLGWIQKFEQHTNLDFKPQLPMIMAYCSFLGVDVDARYTVDYKNL